MGFDLLFKNLARPTVGTSLLVGLTNPIFEFGSFYRRRASAQSVKFQNVFCKDLLFLKGIAKKIIQILLPTAAF